MTELFKKVGRINVEGKDSIRPLLFERHSAEYLGKKILADYCNHDDLLKDIVDDEPIAVK